LIVFARPFAISLQIPFAASPAEAGCRHVLIREWYKMLPALPEQAVIVMDNASFHRKKKLNILAQKAHRSLLFLSIQEIHCRSLAAISNFFKVTKNGENYNLTISDALELNKFFSDKTTYSLEHFIVGKSGKLYVQTAKYNFYYRYPSTIQRYRNSLFNFIFIPQPINNDLSNKGLFAKVEEIQAHEDEIKCNYSKEYYLLLNNSPRLYFQRCPTEQEIDYYSTEEDVHIFLDDYFTKAFPEEFLQFSIALVKNQLGILTRGRSRTSPRALSFFVD